MKHRITVLEHDRLYPTDDENLIGINTGKVHYIDRKSFESLKSFVSYEENYRYLDVVQGGKALQAKQFVGVIETKTGTTVEILPKIAQIQNTKEIRRIFINMLRRLKHSPFKHIDSAHLQTDRIDLLDIFISMFLEELSQLIKKGIAADYITIEENSPFLKGKLKIKEQLRKNLTHQERFFIAYDAYETNRIENRLIKSTLLYIMKKSRLEVNKKRIREFLFVFEDVLPAKNPKEDFSKVVKTRQLRHYETILEWCELFLNNRSFVGFKGNDIAFALLFDMNKIFEDFVAYQLKKHYPNLSIKTQHSSKHLLTLPQKQFKLFLRERQEVF